MEYARTATPSGLNQLVPSAAAAKTAETAIRTLSLKLIRAAMVIAGVVRVPYMRSNVTKNIQSNSCMKFFAAWVEKKFINLNISSKFKIFNEI